MTFRYKLKGQEAYDIQVQTEGSRPMTFRYKLKGQEAYGIQVLTEGSRGLYHSAFLHTLKGL